MMNKKDKMIGLIQIFLLIGGVFAFAYIIKETNFENKILLVEKKSINLSLLSAILKLGIKMIFSEKSLVSALEPNDLSEGVATCVKGKDGSICQEYPKSECSSKCEGECFPTNRNNVPSCRLGTCFDPYIGTCQERAPEANCEEKGGEWLDDIAGNVAECKKACCVVGEDVRPLVTKTECDYISKTSGIETEFRADLRDELACLALARQQVEGACVFELELERSCRFLTKGECLKNNGKFFEGTLCSAEELGMKYQKQATAKCVEGKDEIYWFDSEGNRENIYDANKARSWNNGEVLLKEEACKVEGNQKTCGNCDRLFGSTCGQKTSEEKLSDNSIDVVCRDLRCKDKNSKIRENGESWCEYQGAVGSDKGSGGFERAVDTPGSAHFRATCVDGGVQINSCADYRNEICIEQRDKREDGKEISSAACITNIWQLCLSYNTKVKGEGEERTKSLEERDKKCTENPHCILKKVDIAKDFKFNLCAPRYSPGFDLQKNAEGGELSCAFANQKCTVVYVKKISGWKVEVNEGCLKQGFAEQLNDLCMSLGDCGASVNYIGDLTENYRVTRTPRLGESYLDKIKRYSEIVNGQFIEAENITKYIDAIGGIEKLGGAFDPDYCKGVPGGEISEALCPKDINAAGTIAGLSGTVLATGGAIIASESPYLAGISGALAGAAIGFAVTALLIQYTGIAAGLDPAVVWGLIGAGTAAGFLLGGTFAAGALAGGASGGLSAILSTALIPLVGWIILAVVVIIIVVFKAIGVGEIKKRIVEFQCLPWQPVLGGEKCNECGGDGYPCSKYACQSLGQTCRLINEDTNEEKCVDISPNDISSPVIKPWEEALSEGYRYEEISDKGFKILNKENDGCIASYTNLIFGISLDEPGYCKYDVKSTNNFDSMEFDFGGRNLFLEKHAQLFSMPDLTSLGVSGYDPNRRAEFDFHIRCIDGNGNGKDSREYIINLCVEPGEDKTPPIVNGREPIREEVKFDAKKLDASIFINEPATCRWSLNDKKYDEMENKFECENDIVDMASIFGWKCKTAFDINKDDNLFYVKCKDQPWYGENWQGEGVGEIGANESKRNEMPDAYKFIVKRTKSPLSIDYIKPSNETLVFGVQPATVILEVKTSGGIDDKATCNLFGSPIAETFGSVHKQIFSQIYTGEYEFPVMCEDLVGNSAEAISRFKVELDVDAPKVTRAYKREGSLIIVTNENAECRFVNGKDGCGFNFVNGSLMSGNEKIHSANFDSSIYHIKCADNWGNAPGECSVIVRG